MLRHCVLGGLLCLGALTGPEALGQAVSQQAYLKASNTGTSDRFGFSVAVSGDTAVIGAVFEGSGATGVNGDQNDNSVPAAGAVYVFVRCGSSWTQQAYLKASNTGALDGFGQSVALSGDTLVVGASGEASSATGVNGDQGDDSAARAGAAYVFVRNGTTWSQQAYLKASNAEAGDDFGYSVAVSGETLVVGARQERSNATGVDGDGSNNSSTNAGAAYVFIRNGTTWSQQAYLKASNTDAFDAFGHSLSMADETIVVAARGEDSASVGVNGDQSDDSASGAGAAYVFTRNGTTWSQQAYLKASNTEANDVFGFAVAMSGDTLVAGAFGEGSAGTGVAGDQNDNSAAGAGAAYVFFRNGTTWSQQAYLKASNTEANDSFGKAVVVSGETLVVTADWEDSLATGAGGDQGDNSAIDSGAAYVFVRGGTTWSQQAYLKASNTEAGDFLGNAVGLSGDTLLVAAGQEDSSASGVDGDQGNNNALLSGASYVFDISDITPEAWSEQGCALAGVTGDPSTSGAGTLAAGSNNTVVLANAAPSATAALFLALASTPVPFKGGTLLPFPFLSPVFLTTSPAGALSIPFAMPVGVPSGTELWVQWGIQDAAAISGVALSNAILGITP